MRYRKLTILIEELAGSLWTAGVAGGRLQSLEMDPVAEEVRWGSIFWARVTRIDKALDAAFVDLDGVNTGILYSGDVRVKEGKTKGQIGQKLSAGQMVAVQAKTAYLPSPDKDGTGTGQVSESKMAKVSMDISLPGRYLIYTPLDQRNRVSRRIRQKKLRGQMEEMLADLGGAKGVILRAAAADIQTDILTRESKILTETWRQLQDFFTGEESGLIMLGPDAFQRTIADLSGTLIERIEITTMDQFQETEEWCEIYAPDLVTKIHPVSVEDPQATQGLFDVRDVAGQIDSLFQPYVILPGGAALLIQQTAALTAIDVNSAADKRSPGAINLDAAAEIARQLRLRNLGGIIVIDFLRMKSKSEQQDLLTTLEDAFLDHDSCTVDVHGFTGAGLVELTRQRRTPPLAERFAADEARLL